MERWAQGKFDADWPGAEPAPTPLDKLPEQDRPQALDRAALEACVGGPFFPGIEASRVMLDETTYDKQRPFRINANLPPGTLTARMAVPWQADFNDCSIEQGADWWPGQRPNQVRRGQEHHAEWVPDGLGKVHRDMVDKWSQLGFVVAKTVANKVEYVEDERSSQNHLAWPECDVVVLGGGPAGAAAAITLARAGRSVVVIEKSHYEQARIGETLPPAARPLLADWRCGSHSLPPGICLHPASCRCGAKRSCTRLTLSSILTGKAGISIGSDSIRCWRKRRGRPGRVSGAARRSLRACRSLVTGWQVEFTSGCHGQRTAPSTPRDVLDRRHGTRGGTGAPARGQTAQYRSAGWPRRRAGRSFA